MTVATIMIGLVAFGSGFALALSLVGYGVRGGVAQIIRLWTYRAGWCQCSLCRPK